MGPIAVAAHLADFLPGHPVVNLGGENPIGPVAAAPWGSASILVIPWMYIALMGPDGLTEAAKVAILNANYIATRLEPYFPTLYRGHRDPSTSLGSTTLTAGRMTAIWTESPFDRLRVTITRTRVIVTSLPCRRGGRRRVRRGR